MSKKTSKHKNGKTPKTAPIKVKGRTYEDGYNAAQQNGVQIIGAILRTVPEERIVVPEALFTPDEDITLQMKVDKDKNRILYLERASDVKKVEHDAEFGGDVEDDDVPGIHAYDDDDLAVQGAFDTAVTEAMADAEDDTTLQEGMEVSGVEKRPRSDSFPYPSDDVVPAK